MKERSTEMANKGIENLIPVSERAKEEAREISKQGGIASGEARRRKRDLKRALEVLLEKDIKAKDGTLLSGAEALAAKQFEKALKGDTKAFEVIRDTSGQKPVDRVEQVNIDAEYLGRVNELKDIFNGTGAE